MDNKIVGSKIKQLRKDAKMTQPMLADKIGRTESSIRKYEKGVVEIPLNVLTEIAHVFKVPVVELISEKDDNYLDDMDIPCYEPSPEERIENLLDLLGYGVAYDEKYAYVTKNNHTWTILKPQYDSALPKILDKISADIEANLKFIEAILDFSTPIE